MSIGKTIFSKFKSIHLKCYKMSNKYQHRFMSTKLGKCFNGSITNYDLHLISIFLEKTQESKNTLKFWIQKRIHFKFVSFCSDCVSLKIKVIHIMRDKMTALYGVILLQSRWIFYSWKVQFFPEYSVLRN